MQARHLILMITSTRWLVVLLLAFSFSPAQGQTRSKGAAGGGMGGAPVPGALQFNAAMTKLFGDHRAFTTVMEVEVKQGSAAENISMPTKLSFLEGKSRIEIDLSRAKGPQIPPGAAEQLKAMGMSDMTMISREDKQVAYLVYPGLQSYAEMKSEEGANDAAKIKVSTSEIGRESIDGHVCVKNKVTVTDANGKATDATVWNATDLKQFPLRIETAEGKDKVTMKFKDVKFEKPAATLFDPPASFTRYDSVQTMMQEAMMKKLLGGAGGKPGK